MVGNGDINFREERKKKLRSTVLHGTSFPGCAALGEGISN
jgi:hypothetical protein